VSEAVDDARGQLADGSDVAVAAAAWGVRWWWFEYERGNCYGVQECDISFVVEALWADAHAVVLQHSDNLIVHLPGVDHKETADWSALGEVWGVRCEVCDWPALGDASDDEARQQEHKEEKIR
jgi:hypothetical protein